MSVVVETSRGSYGFLPNRLDMVAALIPGILTFELPGTGKVQCAIDEGILVKVGYEILISVRHAMEERKAGSLRKAFEREVKAIEEREKGVRAALAKLESGFLRGLTETR